MLAQKKKQNNLIIQNILKKIMRNNCNRYKTAFTLVELLIAISIFATVIAVVYTTLYTGLKAYHRIQAELRLNQEINQVVDKLSTELRNCYDAEYDEEKEGTGFLADANSLSFFTIQNIYLENASRKVLARVAYIFEDGTLFKKIQIDKDAFLDEGTFPKEELIGDIEECNFQYLYFESLEEEPKFEWVSDWEHREFIPSGIKIKIKRRDVENDITVYLERYIFLNQGTISTME